MKNHWHTKLDDIQKQFLRLADEHAAAHPNMEEWELVIFEEDQLDFYEVVSQATVNVEAAFVANRGTLRDVVNDSIQSIVDALRTFEDALF